MSDATYMGLNEMSKEDAIRYHVKKLAELTRITSEPDSPTTGVAVDPYPYLTVAKQYEGRDEDDDNDELREFLGINPSETAWCAAFVGACLRDAGLPTISTLRARNFAGYGEAGDGSIGDIAVWRNHVAFVADTDPEEKVIGGNQSDQVNTSPKNWYDRYSEFLGYRRPPTAVA